MERTLSERAGELAGVALAPITFGLSAIRRARMFHPRGHVALGHVQAYESAEPWRTIAAQLEGPAILRLSSAWWKKRQWPDVLGCAIRFTRTPDLHPRPRGDDQDLLLATIRRPWTMPFAPLGTRFWDFLANDYYAVSPYEADAEIQIELRLVPRGGGSGTSREERLRRAVEEGRAQLELQARPYRRVIDVRAPAWHGLAIVRLERLMQEDARELRFDPFYAGRGLQPAGLVNALRMATYGASQRARAATT